MWGRSFGQYTLTVFDKDLNILRSVQFGASAGRGSLAITSKGNYAVAGYDGKAKAREVIPAYWEYSPKLELLSKQNLSDKAKHIGNGEDVMRVLTHGDDLYVAYGWQQRFKGSDSIYLTKLKGSSGTWEHPQEIPFDVSARFFMSADGNPYALEVEKDAIHQTIFRKEDSKSSMVLIDRPT